MDTLWTGISWVARVFAWIGGAMIMIAALVVSTEVICRKLFAFPFSGSDEIGAYLFAVGTSWSMAFVLVTRGHVRIDALYGGFSPFVRAVFDLVALTGLAVLVIALTDRSWELVSDNLSGWNRSNTPLRVPLPYPQLPWFFGLRAVPLALTVAYLRAVTRVRRAGTTPRSRLPRVFPPRTRRSRASSKASASGPSRLRRKPDTCSAPPCSF